jgi:ABC-type sugar transport system permease subunit/ABC-type glycerol-3-phosphate transport system substrate-binding protein
MRILFGCALALLGWAASAETVTLHYWGNDSTVAESDVLVAFDLIQDFESLHDGSDGKTAIKVIMGQSGTFDRTGDPQRLLCAIAGGDPPDVVWFDRFAVGEWASRGAFMQLQTFLDDDLRERPDDPATLKREQFFSACWDEANYDNQLFAIPSDTDNRALFYNLDTMEKHATELIAIGCVDPVDPSKVGPPRTWEQLKNAAKLLTTRDASKQLLRIGFLPHSRSFGNSWLYIYGWLNGGEFMSKDGRTCTLNSPEIVDALTYLTEIYDIQGGASEVIAFQQGAMGADLDPFMSGKIAMKIDGNFYLTSIANIKRDMRFGVTMAPAPEGKQRVGWCGGFAYVIPRGAKHPDEAWEFIKYMASQRAFKIKADASKQLSNASGNVYIPTMSARKDITDWAMNYYVYPDPGIADKFKDAMRVFVDAMPYSRFRPVTPVGQLLWNEQVRGMENGIYKEFDKSDIHRNAQLALDFSTHEVQKELDQILNPVDYPVLSWTPIVIAYVSLLIAGFLFTQWLFGRTVRASGYFRREHHAGYLFATPWFFGFAVFGGGPILFSLFMSFCQYDVFTPPRFVGMKNYTDMFVNDPQFLTSLYNTLFMMLSVPLSMALGLGIAMLLSKESRGMAAYRTLFYLPAIMPIVAAALLWMWILNPQEGVLNNTLKDWFGIAGPAWLQDKSWAKPGIILMILWSAGGGMIVWLAGLKGIPQHLYEAAELDGAGPLQRFRHVTLPMLSPYILFNLIMGLIGTFQIFSQAFIMTQGGPVDATLFFVYHLFNNAFRYLRMGYASSMAWVLFAIVFALTVIQLRLARIWVYYESED